MKVFWRNYLVEGATWEAQADMRSRYPIFYTFQDRLPTLKSKFPYLFIQCCYCLIVYNDYVMI